METTGLRTLNAAFTTTTPFQFRFCSKPASVFRPFYFTHLKNKFPLSQSSSSRFSPSFCTFELNGGELVHMENPRLTGAEKFKASALSRGSSELVSEVSQSQKFLQVVLVSPQIPGNTGCIARTCAASAVGLHLVEPLGFRVEDAKLKRAGLDYWPYVVVKVHGSWGEFRDYFQQQDGEKRLLALTKNGTKTHSEFSYQKGDWLVFGSETSGLPPEALLDCKSETLGGGTIRIPMVDTYVRCLNLSVSVGIALYEASRQLNYEQLQFPSEPCSDSHQSIITEDIFA